MKKLLLLGLGLLLTSVINGQVTFTVLSPSSIAGDYANKDGKTDSNWGAGLENPADYIEDTLVSYLSDTLGCIPATNAADISGHIAILYRGDCEFGMKAKNAELAGAIACVVINNEPGGAAGMDGGATGPSVQIPIVMISESDGALLINEMKNGPVKVFIGNKAGYYADDLGVFASQILRPRFSSFPSALATNGTEYDVELGGAIHNFGSNDQVNVTLRAIISFEGTELYNEVSTPVNILSGDSAVFSLPVFAPTSWAEGYYSLNYIAKSDAVEEYIYDNENESDFVISPTDLSYASINKATLLPNSIGGVRVVGPNQTPIPYYSSCINFKDANASKLAPLSFTFSAIKKKDVLLPSLEGTEFLLQVFKYNDVFVDMENGDYVNPIADYTDIMLHTYTFPSDLSNVLITEEFKTNEIVALEDNQRYMFCVTTFDKDISLGSDPSRDYTMNRDHYLQPMFPIEAGAGKFNPNGFGPGTVPGIAVSFIEAAKVGVKNEKFGINMNAYPSPASDLLNVDFKQNEVSKVELVNMMGQTVVAQNVTDNADKATMNVANVQNGVYIVKVYLTNNMTHTMQVVINH